MKIKITNYRRDVVEDEQFGTCELCMHTGVAEYEEVEITPDDGSKPYWVPLYYWSWGDMFTIYIDNLPRFSAWVAEQEIDEEETPIDYSDLQQLVYDYEEAFRVD